MTRVATYARVSTDMQAEEGKSIAAQQAEMRDFAQARGWEIVAEFVDPGFSGTTLERPGLDALRAAAHERAFDILLVHELSRLSRRLFDTFRLFEEFGKLDIGFASVKEPNFDFTSPTGRLFLTLIAALNQYYVDLLKMHTAKSKRERARRGLYNASILPYGYEHAGTADTPPVVVEEEARIIRELFERYATGKYSFQEVADWLTDAGYKTRTGYNFSKDTVADILRNPFYKGIIRYRPGSRDQEDGEFYPGQHEAIVSAELWEMCRMVREQRRGAPRTYQPKYRVYLLNGIASCDVCGRKLRAQGTTAGSYYREVSRQRGFRDCPDAGRGVRVEVIDQQVGAILRCLRLPPDWQSQLQQIIDESEEERPVLENRRSRLIAERKRLKRMKIRGEFDEDEDVYKEELARIERELAALPSAVDLETIGNAAVAIEELSLVWDEADQADRRDLLRISLRDVQVDMSQGRVTAIEPYAVFVPLFRQVPFLRETAFGVFAPLWSSEQVGGANWLSLAEPLADVPSAERAPHWPLVVSLPTEVAGVRINPLLSDWLKARRKAGQPLGRIVEVARLGVAALEVDPRKWPDVTVEQAASVETVEGTAAFLWTPFALQRTIARLELIEQVRQTVEPGGTWAFVDVLPAAMPGHWLYQVFPAVWENEQQYTWDTSALYNHLFEMGFEVNLRRRTFYQPIRLGVAYRIVCERACCPQLVNLPDEIYEAGVEKLRERMEREGAEVWLDSEFCLAEVAAVRQ